MKSASLGSPVRREKKKVKAQTVVFASSGKSRGSRYQQSKSSPISKANSALPSTFKKRTRLESLNSTMRPRKEKATGSISHCDLITTPESRQPDMMSPASALEICRPALIYDSLPFPIRMLVYLRRKAERLGGNPIKGPVRFLSRNYHCRIQDFFKSTFFDTVTAFQQRKNWSRAHEIFPVPGTRGWYLTSWILVRLLSR